VNQRRLRLAAAGAVAVVAIISIVVAIFLINHRGSTTSTAPTKTKTEPLTGLYKADFGPQIDLATGKQFDGATTTGEYDIRSLCPSTGCVAIANARSGPTLQPQFGFDDVGGTWIAVGVTPSTSAPLKFGNCRSAPGEIWEVIKLRPKPDGTFSGEYEAVGNNNCNAARVVTLTRIGDVNVNGVPDPALLVPRLVSVAQDLHGHYKVTSVFSDNKNTPAKDLMVRTYCLRTADRCMSFFHSAGASNIGIPLVFAGGRWTWNEDDDKNCRTADGTMQQTKITAEFPLPQPLQKPISLLTGHGRLEAPPGVCANGDFDARFERTGD